MITERVVLKDQNEETAVQTIEKFTELGWLYTNISEHGNGFVLRFDWAKESPPVYPKNYHGKMNHC